jgi:hypothetical protein
MMVRSSSLGFVCLTIGADEIGTVVHNDVSDNVVRRGAQANGGLFATQQPRNSVR